MKFTVAEKRHESCNGDPNPGINANAPNDNQRHDWHRNHAENDDGAVLVLLVLWEKLKRIKVIFTDSAYSRDRLPDYFCS